MLHAFTTCIDDQGNVIGTKFFIKSLMDEEDDLIELAAMGNMAGTCANLILTSPI